MRPWGRRGGYAGSVPAGKPKPPKSQGANQEQR
jgi:hypothetical protein